MLSVREKVVSDNSRVAEIVALATEELRRVYHPILLEERITAPDYEKDVYSSLVGVEGGVVVGVIEYRLSTDSTYFMGLAVHPQQRQRGIARVLIDAVKQIAASQGKKKITLSTIKETGNTKIFNKLGFRVINETPAKKFQSPDGQQVTQVDMYLLLG